MKKDFESALLMIAIVERKSDRLIAELTTTFNSSKKRLS